MPAAKVAIEGVLDVPPVEPPVLPPPVVVEPPDVLPLPVVLVLLPELCVPLEPLEPVVLVLGNGDDALTLV